MTYDDVLDGSWCDMVEGGLCERYERLDDEWDRKGG